MSIALLCSLAAALQVSPSPAVTRHGAMRRAFAPMMAKKEEEPKKKLDLSGLFQVMAMGAGAPMLGDLKEVNFKNDGKPDLMFELEANNFDEGLNTRGSFFDDGNEATNDYDGPGFFENLLSGGKLQREADARRKKKQEGQQ